MPRTRTASLTAQRRSWLLAPALLVPSLLTAQPSPEDHGALLSRGEAFDARVAATSALAAARSDEERCSAMFTLIGANHRLGTSEEVRRIGTTYLRICQQRHRQAERRIVDRTLLRVGATLPAPFRLELPAKSLPSRADDWKSADPASVGIDTTVLRLHREVCATSLADACIVVRRGYIVDEWYGVAYREPLAVASTTKSIVALLIGSIVAEGRLHPDSPVARFIPEWRSGAQAGVTVAHLLGMTSGLPGDRTNQDRIDGASNKLLFAFNAELVEKPGTAWAHSNTSAFLLSPIIERASGKSPVLLARARLFDPLGMGQSSLATDKLGHTLTHAGMKTTPRDLARIGQFVLDVGSWRGIQLLPRAWMEKMLSPSQGIMPYGFSWWLDVANNGFAARGEFDNNVYIFPKHELVIVRMQGHARTAGMDYESRAAPLFDKLVASERSR